MWLHRPEHLEMGADLLESWFVKVGWYGEGAYVMAASGTVNTWELCTHWCVSVVALYSK